MPDSYTNLLYHIVFSTKDRRPLITDAYQSRLYDYIGGTIRGLGGISLALNGTEDHVHLLAKLRPDSALSDVLRDLKANASGWMHDLFSRVEELLSFTVSQSNVEEVRRYIAQQKEHHQKISFRDEFIQFLKANGIEYENAICDELLPPVPRASGSGRRRPGAHAPGFMLPPAPQASNQT